jgi:predicted transposase YdaD
MILRHIFEVDEHLTVDELQMLATTIGEDIEEEIVTLADRLREEGRQKGERAGERNGQRKLLLKQLTLRFGKLPEATVSRVNAAGVDQLETWAERVLTAPTLAEVIDPS